ncbi:hypothetical protein NCAS_0C05090 [Naumovozyma castellii]|uniref:Inner membrane assembly complex subunit 22 n=1 Tax=Naumovozyma castellii TaxID=27288 RepID=G0VDD7_NAUCA|nr:hypothetical protein NCAS_0C05090 [Naumovozyma castellii CBS 4309]CCC69499.1 hypothetical protein NCAS_0C05090 [Naumovozyma castellii CBS 4309]
MIRQLKRLQSTAFPILRVARLYATTSSGISPTAEKKSKYDRSLWKPITWVIIFGSLLTSITNQENKYRELERRYNLKINVLKDLIGRVHLGDRDFQIEDEMRLVNKLFDHAAGKDEKFDDVVDTLRVKDKSGATLYSSDQVLMGMNRKSLIMSKQLPAEEDSLEAVLKSILNDINTDEPVSEPSQDMIEGIITDKKQLEKEKIKEEEILNYVPDSRHHLIAEKAGDITDVAKETKISKFL